MLTGATWTVPVSHNAYDAEVRARVPWWARKIVRFAGWLSPYWTAAWMVERMTTTSRKSRRADEVLLAAPTAMDLAIDRRTVRVYRWGSEMNPPVLLVHGWESDAFDFQPLVARLLAADLQVIAFDAPGHGNSSGEQVHPFEFCKAFEHVARVFGPFYGVVAHSLGAAASCYSIARGTPVGRLVLVAPAVSPATRVEAYAALGGETVKMLVLQLIRTATGHDARDLDIDANIPKVRCPVSIFHDSADRAVPAELVMDLISTWPHAELIMTTGYGHRRILNHPTAVESIAQAVTPRARITKREAWTAAHRPQKTKLPSST